jgi:nicotinamidase-related amidase
MLSLGLDAVNHGYQFVLPRDAVAGLPVDYAEAVVRNTFGVIGTVVEAKQLIDLWSE